jgi:hypothetical protein
MSGKKPPITVCLSDHLNGVTSRCDPRRELCHVRLDATNRRKIAGADKCDPHASAATLVFVSSAQRI